MSKQHGPRFERLCEQARARIREISIDQLRQWQESGETLVLLDVREESEWARDHLPGAAYLGRGIIERDIEARYPRLDTPLVLYCGGGYRSALAADNLQQMGYTNVWSLAGGYRAWQALELPLVK